MSEQPFPYTRWTLKRGKMSKPPEAPAARRPKAVLPALQRRNPREPLTTTISLRGGSEAWIECRTRGRVFRLPGHASVLDLVLWVNEGGPPPYDRSSHVWLPAAETVERIREMTTAQVDE